MNPRLEGHRPEIHRAKPQRIHGPAGSWRTQRRKQHNRAGGGEKYATRRHSTRHRETRSNRFRVRSLGHSLLSFHYSRIFTDVELNLCSRICNCFSAV